MGNIGTSELLLILVLALLLLGPRRLPEIGAALGKSLRRFREASRDLRGEIDGLRAADPTREARAELDGLLRDVDPFRAPAATTATPSAAPPPAPAPDAPPDAPRT